MKAKQTKPVSFNITVKLWTLKDKDSFFRAKEPDRHIVEIWADDRICIREFGFDKAKDAEHHYRTLKYMFERR